MKKGFSLYPWDHIDRAGASFEDGTHILKEIADCGFNSSPFVTRRYFDACRKAGLHIRLMPDSFNPWKRNENVFFRNCSADEIEAAVKESVQNLPEDVIACYLADEPGARSFGKLRTARDAVVKYAPGVDAYVNLFPNYAVCGDKDISQLQAETYEEYLERFAVEVKPSFISHDNYMLMVCGEGTSRGNYLLYFKNLLQTEEVCRRHGLPFQHVICCCRLRGNQYAPTYASLAMQAFTSLAAGARAIGWFIYFPGYFNTPIARSKGELIKTETWYLIKELNRRILPIGQRLFDMPFEGMYFSDATRLPLAKSVTAISGLDGVRFGGNVMVGVFNDNGRPVYVTVNVNYEHSMPISFANPNGWRFFDANADRFRELHTLTDGESPLWLATGDCLLLTPDG